MLRGRPERWIALAALSLAGLAALALAATCWCRSAPTTLILVRHADRRGQDDALTPAGALRARELVRVVERSGLGAIYQSNTARARDTAAPLAQALGLRPIERPAGEVQALLDEILERHRGERVLVVGHGNTVPQLVALAGGPVLPDLPHDEYDNLFVLTACRCGGGAELVRLQYGVPSP